MRQSLVIAAALFGGGCSLIYNPSNLGQPDDAKVFHDSQSIDAPIDAPTLFDADPTMLVIDNVYPKVVYGGQGSGGSFPVSLAIHGHNIIPSFQLSITPSTQAHVVGTPQVSASGDWIAAQLEVDVGSGSGSASALTISVSEKDDAGGDIKTATLTPDMLALQPVEALGSGGAVTIDVANLQPYYSQIDVSTLTVTDTMASHAPVYLRSYSSINIASITANGADASSTTGGAPGIGANCGGGNQGANAGCETAYGGGNGANSSNGGGGGGFANAGDLGVSNTPGGAAHGSADLVNIGADSLNPLPNLSGGGGGGYFNALLGTGSGGGGGGGGGTIIITAGGTIMLGTVSANGGGGGTGTGFLGKGGGGGGGSGGVIIVRSAASAVTATGLSVTGGVAGTGSSSNNGGAGSPGRIRIDTSGTVPSGTSTPAHRGPTFDPMTPSFTSNVSQSVTLHGQPGDTVTLYDLYQDGTLHQGEPMNMFTGTTLDLSLSLLDGLNTICATLDHGIQQTELADTCFEIVYLPQ
ncbi:MAG TPA: hypothetical protein VH143_29320 [Kofleriaceae bacterium]|jgi:hypothetical protein|nr:hypothetical protein [Kofleriaceae bacterium]